MKTEMHKDLPVEAFTTMPEWLSWLKAHGSTESGLWMKFAKKGTGATTITYEQAREGAIMYGWIDGLVNRYDETYYLTRFSPRKPNSVWSKINRTIAEELIAAGNMQAAGLATVEVAKANGRWEAAYDGQSTIEVPPDLQQALDNNPRAKAFFENLTMTNRYAFLYRVQTAHKPELRTARIEKLVAMLAAGKTFH